MPDGLVQPVSVPAKHVRSREGSGCLTFVQRVSSLQITRAAVKDHVA